MALNIADGDKNGEKYTGGKMLREFLGKRSHRPFEGQVDPHQVSYKRFRRRIIRGIHLDGPSASTPVAAGWQCEPSLEFDTVCQRLELESPPRHPDPAPAPSVPPEVDEVRGVPLKAACALTTAQNAKEQRWVWTDAVSYHNLQQQAEVPIRERMKVSHLFKKMNRGRMRTLWADEKAHDLQPFAVLNDTASVQGKLLTKLAAPSLLNDYYTSLLDCSCDGLVALALGSSVYLWNSETCAVVAHLHPRRGPSHCESVSSLCWSRDGRALCIGTRRGEVQLWDVEHGQNMRSLMSHQSVVAALSWKQRLLSSGSVLGHIHHLDPRASAPLVGATIQREGICSLQWSPGDDWLASGSTEGLLHIWDDDITGVKSSRQPVTTMEQPSAVKAMGWCPWQKDVLATAGGWHDGELRIWDAHTGSCLASVNTNSQICSVRWAEKGKYVVTGHGVPHHKVTCWSWEFPSIHPICHLTGHSERVLHLAMNPDNTKIFSAGADQSFHIWEV